MSKMIRWNGGEWKNRKNDNLFWVLEKKILYLHRLIRKEEGLVRWVSG